MSETVWTVWPCDCGGVQREPGEVPKNYTCATCGAKPIRTVEKPKERKP